MRMMHKILHPHRRNSIVYLDDVLIFSKTLAEHKTHVEGVLQALRNARLRLSEAKCMFGTVETSFVGFRVNRHGIHTEKKKVKALQDWPTPKMPTELRGFLGLAGYYRKFVPKFTHWAHLLHDLASKPKSEYVWTSRHADQFKDLKEALISSLVFATLDSDADFILHTDASDMAIGGVLAQKQMFEALSLQRGTQHGDSSTYRLLGVGPQQPYELMLRCAVNTVVPYCCAFAPTYIRCCTFRAYLPGWGALLVIPRPLNFYLGAGELLSPELEGSAQFSYTWSWIL